MLRIKKEIPLIAMTPQELREWPLDIYAPCARGGIINDDTISKFQTPIICGSANNILARPDHADILVARGIICVPDYVANCGGLIDIYYQRAGYDTRKVMQHIRKIAYSATLRILRTAKRTGRSPQSVADEIAESRFTC